MVVSLIAPGVFAGPCDIIQSELSFVACTIVPVELTLSVLESIYVVTLILSFVWPRLNSFTVLLVILPIALIDCSIVVQVLSPPIGFIITPLSLVNVSVGVDETPNAVGSTLLPLALIQRPIEPNLATLAGPCLHVRQPLADIDGTTGQLVGAHVNQGHLVLLG